MQNSWHNISINTSLSISIKAPNIFQISLEVCPGGANLYKKSFFLNFGAVYPPISVKFCSAKQTHVPLGCAKLDVNRCIKSPLRCKNADFWPLSKHDPQ